MFSEQEVLIYPSTVTHTPADIEGNVNVYFQIGNFGTPTSGLLYDYSGAAAAYSVRQLANTAALAMRIREDGTDTETDIGFDANGDLDTAAIASHCGSNNGYVSKWYDQSGEQNDAIQGTFGSQPQIYNGTAVITENGKPAIDFLSTITYLRNTSISMTQPFSGFVAVSGLNTSTGYVHGGTNSGNRIICSTVIPGDYININAGTALGSTTLGDSGVQLLSTLYNSTSSEIWKNGSSIASGNAGTRNCSGFTIGTRYSAISYQLEGKMQEFIYYDSDQDSAGNRSGIETNINLGS